MKEAEKDIYEEPVKHSINVLDTNDLKFRSTIDIRTLDNFNKGDYVIRVNLNSLSMNMPLELESVKIDLN